MSEVNGSCAVRISQMVLPLRGEPNIQMTVIRRLEVAWGAGSRYRRASRRLAGAS
jgi:hypothetical protein